MINLLVVKIFTFYKKLIFGNESARPTKRGISSSFLAEVRQYYINLLLENRYWVLAGIIIYFLGIFLGSIIALTYPDLAEKTLRYMIESFQKRGLLEAEISPLKIFSTNSYTLLLSMGLGFIFGIPTAFLILANGLILGVLLFFKDLYLAGLNFWVLFLSIVPHGVFEYPAILIGAAFGLKFGLSYFDPKVKEKRKEFKKSFVELLAVVPLVLGLLLIAAFIEAKITPLILCKAGILCF